MRRVFIIALSLFLCGCGTVRQVSPLPTPTILDVASGLAEHRVSLSGYCTEHNYRNLVNSSDPFLSRQQVQSCEGSIALSSSGEALYMLSRTNLVRQNLGTTGPEWQIKTRSSPRHVVRFQADEDNVTLQFEDGRILAFDAATGSVLRTEPDRSLSKDPSAIAVLPCEGEDFSKVVCTTDTETGDLVSAPGPIPRPASQLADDEWTGPLSISRDGHSAFWERWVVSSDGDTTEQFAVHFGDSEPVLIKKDQPGWSFPSEITVFFADDGTAIVFVEDIDVLRTHVVSRDVGLGSATTHELGRTPAERSWNTMDPVAQAKSKILTGADLTMWDETVAHATAGGVDAYLTVDVEDRRSLVLRKQGDTTALPLMPSPTEVQKHLTHIDLTLSGDGSTVATLLPTGEVLVFDVSSIYAVTKK